MAMTPLEWIATAGIDFFMSLAAFVIWTHFDLEGWWQERHIAKGKKLDFKTYAKWAGGTSSPSSGTQAAVVRQDLRREKFINDVVFGHGSYGRRCSLCGQSDYAGDLVHADFCPLA